MTRNQIKFEKKLYKAITDTLIWMEQLLPWQHIYCGLLRISLHLIIIPKIFTQEDLSSHIAANYGGITHYINRIQQNFDNKMRQISSLLSFYCHLGCHPIAFSFYSSSYFLLSLLSLSLSLSLSLGIYM
jgi:hypothetical protein